MVKASAAIRKGDSVVIRAVAGSLVVRMKGLALQEGAVGKQIQVRNVQSRRIIRAIVTGPGQVEVPM
jgi:flagella basal body P-ring formation protein FlgA